MSIHSIQISIAQLSHLWVVIMLGFMIAYRSFKISVVEVASLVLFLYMATVVTFLQDFPRVKEIQQLSKFAFFYPCFYFVGRWLGWRFRDRMIPIGYTFLFIFLGFQYVVQLLEIPVLFRALDFGEGALHGTFRERNWLAVYFLMFSYALLLKDHSPRKFVPFIALNTVVMLLSGSKTTFVACGIIFLMRSRIPLVLRILPVLLGAFLYVTVMSEEFSEDRLNVKLEEERGLAFTTSMELIAENPIGYGFGFVEAYFGNSWLVIRGLGEGVNSVFSSPIDLWIIAGFAGLVYWAVFFVGIGNRAFFTLLPIAALTLLNPLHQSELVYFFAGFLVSLGHKHEPARTSAHSRGDYGLIRPRTSSNEGYS